MKYIFISDRKLPSFVALPRCTGSTLRQDALLDQFFVNPITSEIFIFSIYYLFLGRINRRKAFI